MKRERAAAGRGGQDRKFVEALARGLEVLACFGPADRALGNAQIAERTDLPKATVSRLTYTLTTLGYLRHRPELNRYELGTAVISLGYSLMARMDIRRVARPLMQALAEHAHMAVNLGVRDRLTMVYIDTYRSSAVSALLLDIGSQIPIATTSMGRAYLATLPGEARTEICDELRRRDPQAWPRVEAGLEAALVQYREKGYCLSLGDWLPEVNAAAVPLVAQDPRDTMVFSCSGAAFLTSRTALEDDIGPRLLNLVANVRTALGAHPV